MPRSALTICLLCVFLPVLPPFAAADTLIHFTAKPGSGYGQKEELTLSAATGYTFQLQRGFNDSIQIYASPADNSQAHYGVEIGAPYGSSLAVGSYPNATGEASETNSGLYFYGDNNITTTGLPGNFRVLEISYDANGNVLTFAADFVQSNPSTKAASEGQVRYNSAIPATTPGGAAEMANATENVPEKAGSLTVTVNRNGGSAGALAVQYATADCTDLAGRNYAAVSGTLSWADGDATDRTISIPILDSGNPAQGDGTFTVSLSGVGVGLQAQDIVTVVNDDSAITFVHLLYPPDPATGKAAERTFSLDTGYVIGARQSVGLTSLITYQSAVEFSFNNQAAAGDGDPEDWTLDFSISQDQSLGVGDYEDVRQYPVDAADYGHPGLRLSGDGEDTDSVMGNFQVLEAQYDAAGNVLQFAANFVEYADGSAQPIRGAVRYRSTVALPVETPQVTAIATAPQIFDAGPYLVLGVFKIVRTGDTTKPLNVAFQLDGKTVGGQKFRPFTSTETIPAGRSFARIKIGVRASGAGTDPQVAFYRLTLKTPADGSYTVPDGKAVKILVPR